MVNSLVYRFYGCYSPFDVKLSGSLVLVMVCFKASFDHYYGGISHRSQSIGMDRHCDQRRLVFQIRTANLSVLSPL